MKSPEQRVTKLISKINKNIKKIKAHKMTNDELNSTQVSCIYFLYNEGPLTIKDLTEFCDEDKAQISRSLEHLLSDGYITYEINSTKKYRINLMLTEKGKLVGKDIHQKVNTIFENANEGITEEEKKIFYQILTKINALLIKVLNE